MNNYLEDFIEISDILVPPCDTRLFIDKERKIPLSGNIRTPLLKEYLTMTRRESEETQFLPSINDSNPQITLLSTKDACWKDILIVDYCHPLTEIHNGYSYTTGSFSERVNRISHLTEEAGYLVSQTWLCLNPKLKYIEILGEFSPDKLKVHARRFGEIYLKLMGEKFASRREAFKSRK